MNIPVNIKEVYRYLGYKKDSPPPLDIQVLIDECIVIAKEIIVPRYTYKDFDINILDNHINILGTNVTFGSENLKVYLKESLIITLAAATLGSEFDKKLTLLIHVDKTKALILDAIGTALIETLCDMVQEEMGVNYKRFSPGYGDFDLSHQRDFNKLLDLYKTTGITLSDSFILNPNKSVTFLVAHLDKNHKDNKCNSCNIDCQYKKES